jgi:hypothetical protein
MAEEPPKGTVRLGKTRLISMSDLDRRTKAAQVALETREAIISDLGGEDQLSTLERLAAEHAALAAAVTQDAYARWLQGQEVSLPVPTHCRRIGLQPASQGRDADHR